MNVNDVILRILHKYALLSLWMEIHRPSFGHGSEQIGSGHCLERQNPCPLGVDGGRPTMVQDVTVA